MDDTSTLTNTTPMAKGLVKQVYHESRAMAE